MVYSTSRCPHCGKVVDMKTNPVHKIGVPFERCRWCGCVYRNSYNEEWITKSPIKRFFFFLNGYVWARAIAIPGLLLGILSAILDMQSGVLFVFYPMLVYWWLFIGYFVNKKASREDISASIQRTNDADYLNLLKKAGFKIYPPKN